MNLNPMAAPMPPQPPMGAPEGPGSMFPSIDPNGPVQGLIGMVKGLQLQDTQRLAVMQNAVLAGIIQQMQAIDLPPEAGFAEGASGELPPAPAEPAMDAPNQGF